MCPQCRSQKLKHYVSVFWECCDCKYTDYYYIFSEEFLLYLGDYK